MINIPEVVLSGKSTLMFGLKLRNLVNAYMKTWNAQSDLEWKKWSCPRCFDHGVTYVGGAGDPFGIWEVAGMILSAQESSPMKWAMLPLFVVTKNGVQNLEILF